MAGAIALGMTFAIWVAGPYLERHAPIFAFVIAVMMAGYLGGAGPGLLAVMLNAAGGSCVPRPTIFSFDLARSPELIHLLMFVMTGTLISTICGAMHRLRRRAEAAAVDLERSNRRTSNILQSITDCFFSLDPDWRIRDINETAATCFGLDRRAVLGRSFEAIARGEECAGCLRRYRCAVDQQTPVHFETKCHQAQGRWVEVHAYPSQDGLSVYFRDITQRKQMEQEREQLLADQIQARHRVEELAATAELHLSQLQAVINSIDSGLVIGDPQGNILSMNPAALRIYGYATIEEVQAQMRIDRGLFVYSDLEGEAISEERWPPSRALAGERFSNYEVCVRRQDTGKEWIGSYGGTPIYSRAGELILTVFTVRDITDAKRAEEELRQAKQVAEAANSAKDRFLAALSHELRTPLTPVLLTLHAMAANPELPECLRRELGMIGHNVELEARLIDDLLDLTRVAKGKLQLREETIDLHALLARSIAISCDSILHRKRLQIETEYGASDRHVRADPGRVQQVFWNIIRNAMKFTPAGGQIHVRTSNGRPGWVQVDVQDTGIGIKADLLPQLFRAFEQGDKSITRRFGGLGLGLAISKAIVELHGGTIAASSDGEGQGATFKIELPVCAAPAASVASTCGGSGDKDMPECGQRRLRILLVEDHEHTAKVLSRLLTHFDHEVKTASSVGAAKRLVDEHRFDLLISDLGLPDGNGMELMRYVRQEQDLPGIALSGFGMDEDIRQSMEAGFVRHLTKPVDLQQLRTAIAHAAGAV